MLPLILILIFSLIPFPIYTEAANTVIPVSQYQFYITDDDIIIASDTNCEDNPALNPTEENASRSNSKRPPNGGGMGGGGRDGSDQRPIPDIDNKNTYKHEDTLSNEDTLSIMIEPTTIAQDQSEEHNNAIITEPKPTILSIDTPPVKRPDSLNTKDTATVIILSSDEIKQQSIANPNNLTFIEHGIKLVIPTHSLMNQLPKNITALKVTMSYDNVSKFEIRFFIDNFEIPDLGTNEFMIYIPWHKDANDLYCYQDPDLQIPVSDYKHGSIQFRLTKTGKYQISQLNTTAALPSLETSAEVPKTQTGPGNQIFILMPPLIMLAGTWAIIKERKKH